ncbi:MAG: hypothetical protein ACE5D0_09970 [Fidelibacterota bacterium]
MLSVCRVMSGRTKKNAEGEAGGLGSLRTSRPACVQRDIGAFFWPSRLWERETWGAGGQGEEGVKGKAEIGSVKAENAQARGIFLRAAKNGTKI